MSINVEHALRPCASIGFAGYWRHVPLKEIFRGDLSWCLKKPTYINLTLSGISGLALSYKTPKWLPVGGALDAFCGAQLTGRVTVNIKDFNISGSLQPWLRLSGVAAANMSATLLITEVAAVAYALYDPFSTQKLILITGIGTGIGISPPIDLERFFSVLGIDIKWRGELLLYLETLLDLSCAGNGKSNRYLTRILQRRGQWGK